MDGWRDLCLELRRRGAVVAILTDGEPMLRPEKVKVSAEVFPLVWVVTNGTLPLLRPPTLKRFYCRVR